jgi:Tfp pilus assembly PilM family ATPase
VDSAQAEKLKISGGLKDNERGPSSMMALITTVSAIRDEVERIMFYWQSHIEKYRTYGLQEISHITLAGQDALIPGLRDYFSVSLKIPTDLANVWVNALSFDDEIPPLMYEESLDYAVALGLALPKNAV